MAEPRNISIASFDYPLPEERIANYPKEDRDSSRLLIYQNESISESVFKNIADHLPPSSLIVLNDTRVVEARILFQKPTGATIEIFCLEPDNRYPDITTAFSQQASVIWKCLVGNASSWTPQLVLEKKIDEKYILRARMISRESDHFLIQLSWLPEEASFAEILHLAGIIPLPPYIKRKAEITDLVRYQTVYAHYSGSVAAPTAGLHFTPAVIDKLSLRQIEKDFVTLHVGAGTFKPVKSETMTGHEMHAEFLEVKRSLIEKIIREPQQPVIAVGTTSLRTLESLYWIGVKLHGNENLSEEDLQVHQWDPYDHPASVTLENSFNAILRWMEKRNAQVLMTKTSLLIVPSYTFRVVSILITNFHQPRSTLLLLVAAFIGADWKRVYRYALDNDFRFLSYGDSCLFFRQ